MFWNTFGASQMIGNPLKTQLGVCLGFVHSNFEILDVFSDITGDNNFLLPSIKISKIIYTFGHKNLHEKTISY